jgi:hypothetical protein
MSGSQWAAPLACCLYSVAMLVAALPSPQELRLANAPTAETREVFTALDRAAVAVETAGAWLSRTVEPLRVISRPYVGTGLGQNWNMFSTPATFDEYVRLEYVVRRFGPRADERHVFELVFPAHVESQVRLWHRYRDKAIHNSLEAFFAARASADTASAGRHLEPLVRYFTNRLRASPALRDQDVVQTRVWYGVAENPGPGSVANPDLVRRRAAVLAEYDRGSMRPEARRSRSSTGGQDVEQDIVWAMLYAAAP